MNKERISDFVYVWAQSVGLKETKYISLIKDDIVKRCLLYENNFPTISVDDDKCNAYIINPVNSEYSLEDFLINRLMLGLREVSFTNTLEGNGGEYIAADKTLDVNAKLLDSRVEDKATRHIGLKGKNQQIVRKTIEHELGHCFKSSFNDGFKAPIGNGRKQDEIYKTLIDNLSKYEDGKYVGQIKNLEDFDLDTESRSIKTGVDDSKVSYSNDYRVIYIDELLNETEALELTGSDDVHEIWPLQDKDGNDSSSGNYVNVYNYLSGYATFTGYGPILKSLLGKDDTFRAEYISSIDIFKHFDQEYANIVQEVWGLDPQKYPPIKCIFMDFDDLCNRKQFDERTMIKLDEFFAKCYEKKFKKILMQNNNKVSDEFVRDVIKELEVFKSKMTTNDNPEKRAMLPHNIIFDRIEERMNELLVQNSSIGEKTLIDTINPDLLKKNMQLPNGIQIPARQYIEEVVVPYIPSNGIFTLKSNGIAISAKQFIEEFVMFECQEKYNGDIQALIDDVVLKEPDDKDGRKLEKVPYGENVKNDDEKSGALQSLQNDETHHDEPKHILSSQQEISQEPQKDKKSSWNEMTGKWRNSAAQYRELRGKAVLQSFGQVDYYMIAEQTRYIGSNYIQTKKKENEMGQSV